MTCSRFSNPSAEILHVDDISYAAFGHQILQGAFVRIGILALGVLQILNMWSPCSVGSIILFDPRAAWECKFRFFQHLCGEHARKTWFLTNPKGYYKFCYLCCPWVRRCFWLLWKMWFPPSVGITFSKLFLGRWIVAMPNCEKIMRKQSNKHVLSNIDQCAGRV